MADKNWNFVIAAYSVAWVFVLAYSIYVHRAVKGARERYDRVTGSHKDTR